MPQFDEQIIGDLISDDPRGGLVVLSAGLGLQKLVSSLLLLHSSAAGSLLILSATPSQKSQILSSLKSTSNPKTRKPELAGSENPSDGVHNSSSDKTAGLSGQCEIPVLPSEITAELSVQNRLNLYASGVPVFITPRILIVDLLTRRLAATSVAGIIILNVHAVGETSTEAFIVRLLRGWNWKVSVWAFSDRPFSMVSGFAKAERTLKCLYLRKLHLWPRFQVYVSEDLERDPPEVVDIRVTMSAYMIGIQKAIIEVMDACLKEMRKTNKVDVEDLTLENGLFKSFDEIVRRQLDPIWHTLGKKTKQIVFDLRTLRKLLDYLVRYDAVTYLKYLDSLRASESFRSVWIFAESSYKIFEYAKKRVYHFGMSGDEKIAQDKSVKTKKRKLDDSDKGKEDPLVANANSQVVLQEVLEEVPKWKVLREVLEELEEEREKKSLSGEEHAVENSEDDNGIVLVTCKDEHSCMQLEECITNGPRKVMKGEWEKYLLSKVQLHALPKRKKQKSKDPKGFGVLNGVAPATPRKITESSSLLMQENHALLAAASEICKRAQKDINVEDNTLLCEGSKEHGKGFQKGRNRKSLKRVQKKSKTETNDTLPESGDQSKEVNVGPDFGFREKTFEDASVRESVLRKHTACVDAEPSRNGKRVPPVYFHALESGQPIFDVLKPSVIIVYHPDMAFVREIEVYKAENPLKKVKVYFLFYEDSAEVQKFEASIRRENGAFETLIRQKSLMMLPAHQDGNGLGLISSVEPQAISSQNLITRKAGGRKEAEKEMQVIVDMREFMSSLPNVLHQKGMHIIPVTLEVGDYILSPLICVERKSIQDLFGSFASGRLYHQVEMMVRYYRMPVLLIEFSQDKSFSFQSTNDIGDDVTPNNIISKLSLLVLHFPRLRIVWSRSLHATAEIFASLKANQDEPDEAKATRVGVPSEDGVVEDDVRAENYNTSAVEFLRRLPGVTDSNYRAIMDGCSSLAELAILPVERLAELVGGQKTAKTLRDFLDAKYPTLL